MLDAANYMARRGWELEIAFPVMHINGGDSSDYRRSDHGRHA